MPKLSSWLRILGRDFSAVWIMAAVGACCGFAINQFRDHPLPLVYSPKAERMQQAVAKIATITNLPATVTEVRYIDLKAFQKIAVEKNKAIILDARPEVFHQFGHVPGAISLAREEFETSYRKHRSLLEKDKSQQIIVYCSDSSCEDSRMVGEALLKLSYTNVSIFKGGWEDWTKAHLPEEKSP